MKTLLLDCDGVILDFLTVVHSKYDYLVNHENRPEEYYDFNCYFNIPQNDVDTMVKSFNASEEFSKIPAFKYARHVLQGLKQDGYDIFVITSCGNSSDIVDMRVKNLHNEIGDVFEDIICLPLEGDKRETLSKWKNTDVLWVDDRLHNCEVGTELGLDSMMFESIYNHYMEHPKVDNWIDLEKIIRNK